MKKITILIILLGFYGYSQSTIEGFIFDKKTNESLPYATIKIISSSNYYTITNEDGMFEVYSKFANDSIEVRFLGFKTKKIPLSYFKNNSKLYLTPNVNQLNEVIIVANKNNNYSYDLLNRLIQKYRNKNSVTESKAYLSLTSSARGIPIEHIEGFYNSEQSLSEGIIDLKIKSGRFGQNKSFPFYSIHNTAILTDFQFFQNSNQILPFYPGNMSLNSIKGKYIVKIDKCDNCSYNDMLISFVPKKPNGRLFFGKILFDKENLIIKKMELGIQDPVTKQLSSIIENDVITPKEINITILFNPINFSQIQSMDFNFVIYYNSKESFEIINSNSFLYFYDYDSPYQKPYFTNNINFNNDYDKILALHASEEFWNLNYQFPKSFNQKKSLSFLDKYGYIINFTNTIPLDYIEYVKPSVLSWSSQHKFKWEIINETIHKDKKEIDKRFYKQGATKATDNEAFSISDLKNKSANSDILEEFKFSYMLDTYINENGERQYVTRTLFDRNSSYCKFNRIKNKLVYIGLIFDVYEVYNQRLKNEISNEMTYEEAKILCDKKFEEASITVEKMKNETNSGLNFQNLLRWKIVINEKLYPKI